MAKPIHDSDAVNSKGAGNIDCLRAPLSKLTITGLKKLEDVEICKTKLASVNIKGCTKLLHTITQPFKIEDGTISWIAGRDESFNIDTTTKVLNGKKVLRQYAKPKSIKFSKSSISMKKNGEYNSWKLLKFSPSTSVYPIEFSMSKEDIVEYDLGWIYANKKGTVTITAKCGKLKPTIKVTVK